MESPQFGRWGCPVKLADEYSPEFFDSGNAFAQGNQAFLRYRRICQRDFGWAARILEDLAYEGHESELVADVWPKLLAGHSLKGVVVEDADKTFVSFGASVFVTDAF